MTKYLYKVLDYLFKFLDTFGIMVLLYTDYLWNKGVYTVRETYFASVGDTENCYYTRHQGTGKRRDTTLIGILFESHTDTGH